MCDTEMEECHEDNPLQQPSPESPNNVRSCWDADDDEFWPGVYDTSYGTSDPTKLSTAPALPATIKSTRGEWAGIDSLASRISNLQVTDTDDARITFANEEEERRKESNRKLIEELQDPARSKPRDADRHDEFMRIFFRNDYDGLPADTSIRHMHLLDLASYFNSTSPIIEYVLPRLCDAVATVLFETDRKCLDDFLDSEVRIFEWRHTYHASSLSSGRLSVIIRREDYRVVVGTYRTHGFKYFWKTFIRSFIHFTGWWSDAFADSGGETAVTAAGPLFDNYKHIEQGREHDRADSHCVLFACRQLALRLLEQRAWEYYDENQEMVEWEANGKVTQAKVTKSSRKYDMEEEMSGPALLAV